MSWRDLLSLEVGIPLAIIAVALLIALEVARMTRHRHVAAVHTAATIATLVLLVLIVARFVDKLV
ncbi:MAG: hypothetical protein H0U77_13180 [Nocardioidaceae bacterium]|nr:hypothetical protein [Nocardioidaceae bacterium]